jgi:hypothetical protein
MQIAGFENGGHAAAANDIGDGKAVVEQAARPRPARKANLPGDRTGIRLNGLCSEFHANNVPRQCPPEKSKNKP